MAEQDIFLAALEISDPLQRMDYLNRVCAGNPGLRRQVEALLAAHERSGKFLDVAALKQIASAVPGCETSEEQPGPNREIDLSFLQPSSRPGSLGRLGHYEIEGVIGRGGYGIVLKAFDEMLQRVVAVKVMAPELAATSPARKRFLREARAAAAIRHDNVVSIHAVEEQPIPFLVMEYIPGQTLQQKLDQTGPLDAREVVQIGQQIAGGLAAAHGKGLIHRDIKPANILLEQGDGRVKITDFGLARTADDASVTQSGAITGTPLYMSPEQSLSQPIDQRSDLFSLGSVMYVMCSGRPPFRAGSAVAVLMRVAQDQPRPIQEIIPEVPDWMVAIIAKLHAKNPTERFGSAKEVADLLGRCLAELQQHGRVESLGDILPISEPPGPTMFEAPANEAAPKQTTYEERSSASQRESRPRRRWVAAAAVLLVLLAGLGLTEATGVTNVRGTVIRLFSPDGTLVVEVDDPGVSVTIDGEEMVITGTGAREIRLRPGQYTVLASKDGKLVRQELVTVTRNGRQMVRVSKEAQRVAANRTNTAAPDRHAAEWVLSIGGSIDVEQSGKQRELKAGDDLPRGPFKLTGVGLRDNKKVFDAGLAYFKDCKNLTTLDLVGTSVTDGGLAHFKDHNKLVALRLDFTQVTDEGLANFKNCKDLVWLGLGWTRVTDAGFRLFKDSTRLGNVALGGIDVKDDSLAVFEHCPNLWSIQLTGTAITDAGLAHFKNCNSLTWLHLADCRNITDAGLTYLKDHNLEVLNLERTRVSNAGLAHFKNCKKLFRLYLSSTNVSDIGLAHFKDCKELKELHLSRSQVSDAGLASVAACPELAIVDVKKTKVTEAGVKKLAAALPMCKIEWDGGVIEPKTPASPSPAVPATAQKNRFVVVGSRVVVTATTAGYDDDSSENMSLVVEKGTKGKVLEISKNKKRALVRLAVRDEPEVWILLDKLTVE
jgi:serine/threonine protein kinase/uncharacterized membrane protein